MKLRSVMSSGLMLGASGVAPGQDAAPTIDPTLMPVVTSIVISSPYGQPPEIRITVASPYGGPSVHSETKATMPPPIQAPQPRGPQLRPQPERKPTAAPAPAPVTERRPTASIGPPAQGATRITTIPAAPPRPQSYAERAAQLEAPYRRLNPNAR